NVYGGQTAAQTRGDVRKELGPSGCAIGHPELAAMHAVVCAEEDLPTDGGEAVQKGTGRPGIDVLDEPGPGRRAVARPEFGAMLPVIGGEIGRPAHAEARETHEGTGRRGGAERLQGLCPRAGAVADPQLVRGRAVMGRKEYLRSHGRQVGRLRPGGA